MTKIIVMDTTSIVAPTGDRSSMVQLEFHELGHNFGLTHPDKDEVDYRFNPMAYASGSLSFSREQLREIHKLGERGLLNQGYNREVIINRVPGYNHRSTNERPFRGQRSFNMIVPKRVPNE